VPRGHDISNGNQDQKRYRMKIIKPRINPAGGNHDSAADEGAYHLPGRGNEESNLSAETRPFIILGGHSTGSIPASSKVAISV